MRFFSWTTFRYLGSRFFGSFMGALLALALLTFIIDLVELTRDVAGRENVGFALTLRMALLRLPQLIETLVPFTILLGTIWTYTRLTRSSELVVARAAGVSVWQFLTPALALALLVGLFQIALFNPVSAQLSSVHDRIYAERVEGQLSHLQVSRTGLWLRQGSREAQSIVHAPKLTDRAQGNVVELRNVLIILYEGLDQFTGRVDADRAVLGDKKWILSDAYVTRGERPSEFHPVYEVPTTLELSDIEDSFAQPKTISFWKLPRFIELAEEAGFTTVRYRLHWHWLLSQPFLLMAMVLIAATFSLRLSRLGGIGQLVVIGTVTGFGLFFISDFTRALGLSGNLPVVLAAWAPTAIAMLLGTSMLLHLEDG